MTISSWLIVTQALRKMHSKALVRLRVIRALLRLVLSAGMSLQLLVSGMLLDREIVLSLVGMVRPVSVHSVVL